VKAFTTWVIVGTSIASLSIGLLVGRWLIPNNGPCTLDYAVVAAWVASIAAVGLVAVGAYGVYYAYLTASSAMETLRIQTEPSVLAGVDEDDGKAPYLAWAIRVIGDRMMPSPAFGEFDGCRGRIRISNVGQRPIINLRAIIEIRDVGQHYETTSQLFFVQGLLPGEHRTVEFRNEVPTALAFSVLAATADSSSKPGQPGPVNVYASEALPMYVG
jgi:hypothetical protein